MNRTAIGRVDQEMEAILNHLMGYPIRRSIRYVFESEHHHVKVMYFGVSSHTATGTGKDVTFTNDCSEKAPKHRIMSPLLWLMASWSGLPSAEEQPRKRRKRFNLFGRRKEQPQHPNHNNPMG